VRVNSSTPDRATWAATSTFDAHAKAGAGLAERFVGKRVLLVMDERIEREGRRFPVAAGILLGLGLGGFFDGIVLHQLLQWHHMLSTAGYPPDTIENLRVNTLRTGSSTRRPMALSWPASCCSGDGRIGRISGGRDACWRGAC
jgi:hypothetical protein